MVLTIKWMNNQINRILIGMFLKCQAAGAAGTTQGFSTLVEDSDSALTTQIPRPQGSDALRPPQAPAHTVHINAQRHLCIHINHFLKGIAWSTMNTQCRQGSNRVQQGRALGTRNAERLYSRPPSLYPYIIPITNG